MNENINGTCLKALGLGARARNGLATIGVFTLEQLEQKTETEVLATHNIGRTTLREIRAALQSAGKTFKERMNVTRPLSERRIQWSSALQCGWTSWRVVDSGHLALDLPPDQACDMRGAIATAESICPLVWRIDVFAGGLPDVTYWTHLGTWKVADLRRQKGASK